MILKIYTQDDYKGEFNLLKSEKRLLIKALATTKESKDLCRILEINEKRLMIAIIRHGVATSELSEKT